MSRNRLFKQASPCGYFWKDNKIIHAALEILKKQNEIIKFLEIKVNSVKGGRIRDDKNKFVTVTIVSIIADTLTHSIGNHMKHIDVPKTTKYRLFRRGNIKRKQSVDAVVDINWSPEKKKKITF